MSRKANTGTTRRLRQGGTASGKPRKAKTPRPDRHGPAGRKKVAKRAALDRARRTGARAAVADKGATAENRQREADRRDAIASMLWAVFTRSCRLLGVEPTTAAKGGRVGGPEPHSLARGLYVLAIRDVGLRTEDYARHRTKSGCLVKELRRSSSWSQVFYLAKRTREWLDASPKSPLVGVARDALGVLSTQALTESAKIAARFGPRPEAAHVKATPSRTHAKAATRAKALGESHAKREARKKAAKAIAPAVVPPPPDPEQLAFAVDLTPAQESTPQHDAPSDQRRPFEPDLCSDDGPCVDYEYTCEKHGSVAA